MKRLVAWVLSAIVLLVAIDSVIFLDEREVAIVTQLGEMKRELTSPGVYFKIPVVQSVHRLEGRIMGSDTAPAEYLTRDKKRLVADPITRFRISDVGTFYVTMGNESSAKARLNDIVNSELRRVFATQDFGEIIGNAREPMMHKVVAGIRDKVKPFGIEVIDVRIKRADLPKEVQESVFKRMQAERERVAKRYRSEGEEEAAKIRAQTDKEKAILLSEAYAQAQKTRGEGDAESIQVYASAYGKDPEFYAFMRSLSAYERSIDDKSSIVLSTGSELFKYLDSPKK